MNDSRQTYHVTIERSNHWWALAVPELPGTFSQAETLAEIEPHIREAIGLMLDVDDDTFDLMFAFDPAVKAERDRLRAVASTPSPHLTEAGIWAVRRTPMGDYEDMVAGCVPQATGAQVAELEATLIALRKKLADAEAERDRLRAVVERFQEANAATIAACTSDQSTAAVEEYRAAVDALLELDGTGITGGPHLPPNHLAPGETIEEYLARTGDESSAGGATDG